MKINKATIEDYESIIAFYDDVTEKTSEMEVYARWQKGKHPTHDGIRAYAENTGWTDFYFFEYKEVTHIRSIEKENGTKRLNS